MSNSPLQEQLDTLLQFQKEAPIRFQTLGNFMLWRVGEKVSPKEWGRDKTIQLIQYLISYRQRRALHKEQVMDHLWEDGDDRDFKVALHGVNKVLEPNRPSRTEPIYVLRQGLTYELNQEKVWIDAEAMEKYISLGNRGLGEDNAFAKAAFQEAIALYQGTFLPNRIYEDWTAEEREKTQVLILGAYTVLAELLIEENPMESVRLTQHAITIDPTWEDAYKIQMQAYIAKGNRPQALKTYKKCVEALDEEYGVDPLPATKQLLEQIQAI